MTFRIIIRKHFWGKEKLWKNSGKWRTWMSKPPPHPHGLMKRALGGFKKIIRPKGPAKKILRLDFALRNLFSHSKIRLSQSEICFRSPKSAFAVRNLLSQSKICFSHSVNCFTHSKSTLYLGNDFSHYNKEAIFWGKEKLWKNSGKWRTWMSKPPPPPHPHGLMKRALGGFKEIIRPEGPAKKILRLDFALRNLFSHSKIRLSQSEICFRSLKSAFAVQNLLFALRKLLYSLQKYIILGKWLFAL